MLMMQTCKSPHDCNINRPRSSSFSWTPRHGKTDHDKTKENKVHDSRKKPLTEIWGSKGFQNRLKRLRKCRGMSSISNPSYQSTLSNTSFSPQWNKEDACIASYAVRDTDTDDRFNERKRNEIVRKNSPGCERGVVVKGACPISELQNLIGLGSDRKDDLLSLMYDNANLNDMKGNQYDSMDGGRESNFMHFSTSSPCNEGFVKNHICQRQFGFNASINHEYFDIQNRTNIGECSSSSQKSFTESKVENTLPAEQRYANLVKTMLFNDVGEELSIDMECYGPKLLPNMKRDQDITESVEDSDTKAFDTSRISMNGEARSPLNEKKKNKPIPQNPYFNTLSVYYGIDMGKSTQDHLGKMAPCVKQSRRLTATGAHQKINASISISDTSKERVENAILEKRGGSNKITENALSIVLRVDDDFKGTKRMEEDKKTDCDVPPDKDTVLSQRNSDFEVGWESSGKTRMPNDNIDINYQRKEADACCLIPERSTTTGNVFEDANNGKENDSSKKSESISIYQRSQERKSIANTKQTRNEPYSIDVAKNPDLIKSSMDDKLSLTETVNEKVLGQLTCHAIDKTDILDHQLELRNKEDRKQSVPNKHFESSTVSSSRLHGVTNQEKCNVSIKKKCHENDCTKKKDSVLHKKCIIIRPDTSQIKHLAKNNHDSLTARHRAACENQMEKQRSAASTPSMELTWDFDSNEWRKQGEMSFYQNRCNWNPASCTKINQNMTLDLYDDSIAMKSNLTDLYRTETEALVNTETRNRSSSRSSGRRRVFSEEGKSFDEMDSDETSSRQSMCTSPYIENQAQANPSDLKRNCSTISNQYPQYVSTEVLRPKKTETFISSTSLSPSLKDNREKRDYVHKDIIPSNSYVRISSHISNNCSQSSPRDLNVGFRNLDIKIENNTKENKAESTTQNVKVNNEDVGENKVNHDVQKNEMNHQNVQNRFQEFAKDAFIRRVRDLKKASPEQIVDTEQKDQRDGHVNNDNGIFYKNSMDKNEAKAKKKTDPQPKENCFVIGAKFPVLSKPLPNVKKYKPNVKIKLKSSKTAENLDGKSCRRPARDAYGNLYNIKTIHDSCSQVNDTTDIEFLDSISNHNTNPKLKGKKATLRNGLNQTTHPNACDWDNAQRNLSKEKRYVDRNFQRPQFQGMSRMETIANEHPHSTGEIKYNDVKARPRNGSNLKAKAPKKRAHAKTRNNINVGINEHQPVSEWIVEDEKTCFPNVTSKRNEMSFSRGCMLQRLSNSLCFDGCQNQEMDTVCHNEEQQFKPLEYNVKPQYRYLYERPYENSRVTLLDLVQTQDLWKHRRQSSGEHGSQDESQVPEYKSLMSNAISSAKSQAEMYRDSMNDAFKMEDNNKDASNISPVRSNTCLILPSINRTGNLVSQGILEENDKNNSCADVDVDFLHDSMNPDELHNKMGNDVLTRYYFKQDTFISYVYFLDYNSYSFEHLLQNVNNNSKFHLRNRIHDRKSRIPVMVKKTVEKKTHQDKCCIFDTSMCSSSYRPEVAECNNGYSNHEYKVRDIQLSACNGGDEKHNINQGNAPNRIHKHNCLLSKCDLFCIPVSDVCDEELNSHECISSVKSTSSCCNIHKRNVRGETWMNDGKTDHVSECEKAEEISDATGSNHTSGISQGAACDFLTFQDTMRYCITSQNHHSDNSGMDWIQTQSSPQSHHVERDNDTDINYTVENDCIISNDDSIPEQTFLEIIHKRVAMVYNREQTCPDFQRLVNRESRFAYDRVESSVESFNSNGVLKTSFEIKAIPKTTNHDDVRSYSLISNNVSNVQHSNVIRSRSYPFESKHTPEPGKSETLIHNNRKCPLLVFDNERKMNSRDSSMICWPKPTLSEFPPVFSRRPRPIGLLQQSIAISSLQLQCPEKQMSDDIQVGEDANSLQCTGKQMPNENAHVVNDENSLQCTVKQMSYENAQIVNDENSLQCTVKQMPYGDAQIVNDENSLQCTVKQMSYDDAQIVNDANSLQCTGKQMPNENAHVVNDENSLQCTVKQMSYENAQIVNDENSLQCTVKQIPNEKSHIVNDENYLQCTVKQISYDDAHIVNDENSLQCTVKHMSYDDAQIANDENSLQCTVKQMPYDDAHFVNDENPLQCTVKHMSYDDAQIANDENSLQCTVKQMSYDDAQIVNDENSLQCTVKQMPNENAHIVNDENSLRCTVKQMPYDDAHIVNDENLPPFENKELICQEVQYSSSSSQRLTESEQGITQRSGQRCPSMWPVVRKWTETKSFAHVDKINHARTNVRFKKGSLTFCSETRPQVPFVITCLDNNNDGVHSTPDDPVTPAIDFEDAENSTSSSSEDEDSCSENSFSYQESDHIHEMDIGNNNTTQGVMSCKFESIKCETDSAAKVKRVKTSSAVDEDYEVGNKVECRKNKKRKCTTSASFTLPPLSQRQVGKPHKEKWRRYY